jgi:hypothetical protein
MDVILVIILVLIGLAIGVVLGLLLGSLRESKVQPSPSKKTDPNLVESARLWWNRENGGLVLETEGQNYQKASDMPAKQRERISETIVGLLDWLGSGEPDTSGSPANTPSKPVNSDQSNDLKAKKPSFNPVDVITQALEADVPQSVETPLSIVAQIDAILQQKLKGSDLEERAIRLMEVPGKGMVVLVGLNKYESLEEVPEGEVKEMIRASVAEWEQIEQEQA